MAQQVREHTALPENSSPVPRTHFKQLPSTQNSSSKGHSALFWPLWAPVPICTYICMLLKKILKCHYETYHFVQWIYINCFKLARWIFLAGTNFQFSIQLNPQLSRVVSSPASSWSHMVSFSSSLWAHIAKAWAKKRRSKQGHLLRRLVLGAEDKLNWLYLIATQCLEGGDIICLEMLPPHTSHTLISHLSSYGGYFFTK